MKYLFFIFALTTFVSCSTDEPYHPVDKCSTIICNEWEQCVDGVCELLENKCNSNEDCLNGYNCNNLNHNCEQIINPCDNITCNEWEQCVEGVCELQENKCNSNEDCLSGYNCNNLTHNCEQIIINPCDNITCNEWEQCVDGVCELLEGKCNYDSDCRLPEKCTTNHKCFDFCKVIQCNETENCIEGVCVLKEGRCNDDSDCPDERYNCDIETKLCVNPCENITCSNHGQCYLYYGSARCQCDEGYVDVEKECYSLCLLCDEFEYCDENFECKLQENRCYNDSDCRTISATHYCDETNTCIDACENKDCGENETGGKLGVCLIDRNKEAVCYCFPGYIYKYGTCLKAHSGNCSFPFNEQAFTEEDFQNGIYDAENPCKPKTTGCLNDSHCANNENYICNNLYTCIPAEYECHSGLDCPDNTPKCVYNVCINEPVEVCENINCNNHGICREDINGNANCICDEGYIHLNNNLNTCVPNICTSQIPNYAHKTELPVELEDTYCPSADKIIKVDLQAGRPAFFNFQSDINEQIVVYKSYHDFQNNNIDFFVFTNRIQRYMPQITGTYYLKMNNMASRFNYSLKIRYNCVDDSYCWAGSNCDNGDCSECPNYIDCGEHGECKKRNGVAVCECEEYYTPGNDGYYCVQKECEPNYSTRECSLDVDICEEEYFHCGTYSLCYVTNNENNCICPYGYELSEDKLQCNSIGCIDDELTNNSPESAVFIDTFPYDINNKIICANVKDYYRVYLEANERLYINIFMPEYIAEYDDIKVYLIDESFPDYTIANYNNTHLMIVAITSGYHLIKIRGGAAANQFEYGLRITKQCELNTDCGGNKVCVDGVCVLN